MVLVLQIKLWRPMYPDNPILETSSKFVLLRVRNAVCLSHQLAAVESVLLHPLSGHGSAALVQARPCACFVTFCGRLKVAEKLAEWTLEHPY